MLYIINAQIRLKRDTTQPRPPQMAQQWAGHRAFAKTFHLDWDLYEEIKHRYIKILFTSLLVISLRENYVCSFPFSYSTTNLCIQRWPSCPKNVHCRSNQAWHSSITVRRQKWTSLVTPHRQYSQEQASISKEVAFAALTNGSMLCLLYQTVQWWSG